MADDKPVYAVQSPFDKISVYPDRVVYSKFFGLSEIVIPIGKIDNVSVNKFLGKLYIETISGQRTAVTLWGSALNETRNAILKLLKKQKQP